MAWLAFQTLIIDDRGTTRRIMVLRHGRSLHGERAASLRRQLDHVAALSLRRAGHERVPPRDALAIVAGLAAWLLSAMWFAHGLRWPDWVGGPLSLGVFVLVFLSIRGGYKPRIASDKADACLKHAVCPCCDYDLQRVPPSGDACVVCPECSAAWRAARWQDQIWRQPNDAEPEKGGA